MDANILNGFNRQLTVSSQDMGITEFEMIKQIKGLRHHNIMKIYSISRNAIDNSFDISMESSNLNLHQYLYGGRLNNTSNETKLSILKQIGKGLKYLHRHDRPIVHRNLHPSSILIFQEQYNVDTTVTAKLSNFYFTGIDPRRINDLYCMPPEFSEDEDYRERCRDKTAVDIFAYGCLIHTVIAKNCRSNYHPFYDLDEQAEPVNVIELESCRKKLWYDDSGRVSLENANEIHFFILADLAINDATDKTPDNRPDISTLLSHPMFWTNRDKESFFKGITNGYIRDEHETADFLKGFQISFNNQVWEKRNYGNLCSRLDEKNYISLVRFVGNKCVNFYRHRVGYESGGIERRVLGNNKDEFIKNMCNDFPDLLYKLFKYYRRHVILNVRFFKEKLPERYHSYFEKLSDSVLTEEENGFFRIPDSG